MSAFAGLLAAMVVKAVTANCAAAASTCHDGVTFLQSRSQHALVKSTSEAGVTCDINDLNEGMCNEILACTQCNLQDSDNLLPTDADRFPDSRLLCESNSLTVCSLEAGSQPVTFKEPSQVMVCKGVQACIDWVVQDFGALCCSSTSAADDTKTCSSSNFELEGNPLCQSDVCCDGVRTCTNSTFNLVESLLCRGELACAQSTFYISRDLYCNEFSPLTVNPTTIGSTCSDSNFFFGEEQHVIDCLGNDVCSRSIMSFSGANANISMLCDSAQGSAGGSGGACVGVTIDLSPGDCLDLNCTQPEDCVDMTVNENGGNCFFIGSPSAPNIPEGCEQKNTTQCGPIIPDEICCRDDPDCGSCCQEPTTTTAPPTSPGPDVSSSTTTTTTATEQTTSTSTTTSTKKKPKPYQYSGRNRRQHRRWDRRWDRRQRRQDRREYRQYG